MRPQIKDITLDLLQKCYQNCLFCSSNSSKDQNTQLEYDVVKNVLREFNILGGKIVEFSGGEPLAYYKINELIKYAKDLGLETHLFTCCQIPKRINYNLLDNIDKIFINLQAPNRELHDYLTDKRGSFERTIEFIKISKEKGKWIGTHFIPLKYNIDEIDDYIKLTQNLKLDNISLLRFVTQGRGKSNKLELNSDEILQLHALIGKYSGLDKPHFKIGCPLDFQFIYNKTMNAKPCVSGISRCVVRPNGNIIPCPAFKDAQEFIAGNVYNNSFTKIWDSGEIFQKIREFDYAKLTGLCSSCNFLSICKGRCHAQRLHIFKNIYKGPDPYCPLYLTKNIVQL